MNFRKLSITTQIMLGMILGIILGLVIGTQAAPLGELGKLIIQLIKTVATPLLFFAIIHAILNTDVDMKGGIKMLVVALFNATLALVLGLLLSNFFKPGSYLNWNMGSTDSSILKSAVKDKIDFFKTFSTYIPSNWVEPFQQNTMVTIVLFAIILGVGIRGVKRKQVEKGEQSYEVLVHSVNSLFQVMEHILHWIVKLAPVAVFGTVAKAVGEYGFTPFKGLAVYVAVGLLGLSLQIFLVYQSWLFLVFRGRIKEFWRNAKEPVVYSIGTNSSLATLPLTLKALQKLRISKQASTLGACVGTNLNNDGIVLYEAMAVLFVAQAHGMDLSLGQQVLAALTCLVAALGVAGVPDAGLISLSIVLSTVGLPLEVLPLLLTVDWVVARARSMTNVISDMVTSIILDRWRV